MNISIESYISIFIHQTDLTLTNYVKGKLSPYNIAPEQNLIMMVLWERDGLTQNEIGQRLNKDKTNIARMAYSLERKGFVRRAGCPEDRRSQRVYLTEEGELLKEKVLPVAEEFNQLVCRGITEEELNTTRKVLSKMRDNVY
ncbi:MarR family winged helix-turn-helix transcriptional regulator [Thalassorhabdus alkalitolerans]|uniref:MarR family winged helix-turn-helix transcriptional regulator n=1 Tax=Thalassorhabdus alkalitolerans TaxID=2282697 RepID=A0ABW0YLY2_9BACI|nr:MarR family transcriptional regulator [Thalassobacillus sp. C254]